MNQNKYVFAQLVEFLDNNKFFRIVQKYDGDKGKRGFTCWNQLLMMLFGQLSNRDSLRDLMTIIEAYQSKAYHLGFGRCVNLSTIARANASRDYRIFEEFAMYIVAYARRIFSLFNNENDTLHGCRILRLSIVRARMRSALLITKLWCRPPFFSNISTTNFLLSGMVNLSKASAVASLLPPPTLVT